jgi:hypothetical protein
LKLEIMGIYGPADHASSGCFLEEISGKVAQSNLPIIMGGDFNLTRIPEDKNNDRINWPRLELFNDHIARWVVREIPRIGARFTWSNRQLNPIRCVLDRVFISIDLEPSFPLCSLVAETSMGSDHTPLVFDTGESCLIRSNRFFFETGWLEGEGFQDTMLGMWQQLLLRVGGRDIVDWWQFMSAGLRQKLRGWSKNKGREGKLQKLAVLAQIKEIDDKADSIGIDEDEWAFRYHLEEQLLEIYRVEEEYWRQRGRIRWLLQGDANTAYFHAVANGRRRKCNIASLVVEGRPISDKREIEEHIYSFYPNLMGASEPRCCRLGLEMWNSAPRASAEENEGLLRTLSENELERIVKDMKSDTAPGPDGFPVVFFKKFWPLVKLGVLHIVNDFILGRIDVLRLNYGVLSLIPKVPGVDQISQFRPIALINVIFKIVSKCFATKLDPIANRIISPNQTAFIKGRLITDGVLALQEVIHEMKVKKLGGILLKLDFEKTYDRVN